MPSIMTNPGTMSSMNAMNSAQSSYDKYSQQLATGKRINSSADDAAGKQIANRLQAQSNGMDQAMRNINDATAMLQTADGMFDQMTNILGRMQDLSTQAANGTYNDSDRQAMQAEFDELGQQMSDMLQNTTYGGTNLFDASSGGLFTASAGVTFQIGAESSDTMNVNISTQIAALTTSLDSLSSAFQTDQSGGAVTAGSGNELMSDSSANATISAVQGAMAAVGAIQSQLGASINRLNSTAANLQNMQDNTELAIGNIMDTNYAQASSEMAKSEIQAQASVKMLQQSNAAGQMVLNLL